MRTKCVLLLCFDYNSYYEIQPKTVSTFFVNNFILRAIKSFQCIISCLLHFKLEFEEDILGIFYYFMDAIKVVCAYW